MSFRFVRGSHPEILQREDDGFPTCVEKSLLMGAVIDEKSLFPIAGAKVTAQEGENPVFRLDLTAQHTSHF